MEVSLSNEHPSRNFRYDLAKAEFVAWFDFKFMPVGFEEFVEAMQHSLRKESFTKISVFADFMNVSAIMKVFELMSYIEEALPESDFPIAYVLEWIYSDGNEDMKEYGEEMNDWELSFEVIPFSEI